MLKTIVYVSLGCLLSALFLFVGPTLALRDETESHVIYRTAPLRPIDPWEEEEENKERAWKMMDHLFIEISPDGRVTPYGRDNYPPEPPPR